MADEKGKTIDLTQYEAARKQAQVNVAIVCMSLQWEKHFLYEVLYVSCLFFQNATLMPYW